jgi:hypothetical protein
LEKALDVAFKLRIDLPINSELITVFQDVVCVFADRPEKITDLFE